MTSNYAEVHERARLCALALRRLGVQQGDRVATVAWNTCRHLESWCLFLSPSMLSSSLCSQHTGSAISAACGLLGADKGPLLQGQCRQSERETSHWKIC